MHDPQIRVSINPITKNTGMVLRSGTHPYASLGIREFVKIVIDGSLNDFFRSCIPTAKVLYQKNAAINGGAVYRLH
jgi:hypothetical protein